ncbi:Serine/threonine protein kinase [Mucilaginibacter gossypiicola]|uniref:Serine/threonine protein kinase n=1 Tax=Mucilaginibacter gossypiicola TaxID=551995 RepID=A0A1H8LW49_9SPHI|nr:lanthionine synthetase LanC family protein [Mucilaginibacter gossypiicola]SEO09374.1 Serine/threonine protein kinase [Mucilaginibacter gossypiicola]
MDVKNFENDSFLPVETQAAEMFNHTNSGSGDYGQYLNAGKFNSAVNYPYLSVGADKPFEGWALHISLVVPLTSKFLGVLLPLLKQFSVPFDIPADRQAHQNLLTGKHGPSTYGKVINLYPKNEIEARQLAVQITGLAVDFAGPDIPGSFKLGNCVFTSCIPARFGHGNPEQYLNSNSAIKWRATGYAWPFRNFKTVKRKEHPKIVRKYVLTEIIKDDPKGKVFKAIRLSWTLNPVTYLIKQGLQSQSYDDHHRDIRSRLSWQFRVHQVLQAQLSIPKVLDYFESDGDGYLVMEYIEGQSLSDRVQSLYAGKSFKSSTVEIQSIVINLAKQVIDIVKNLHSLNYVHRDLNPQNFIVRNSGELVLTDFELSASLNRQGPEPPFGVGTPGYMTREQFQGNEPSIRDDLYGLSGILIKLFSGCSPLKFENTDPSVLEKQLLFFLGNRDIAHEIAALRLAGQALDLRESLSALFTKSQTESIDVRKALPKSSAQETILKGLNIFKSSLYNPDAGAVNINNYSLSSGLSGILLCIAAAKKADFTTYELEDFGDDLFRKLSNNYLWQASKQGVDLFNGNSGIALLIAALLDASMITTDHVTRSQLTLLFLSEPAKGSDLATGKAGYGIALLKCLPFLEPGIASRLLSELADYFMSTQNTDGSWYSSHEHGYLLPPGLFHGTSGILCFLIEYQKTYKSKTADQLISNGVNYILGLLDSELRQDLNVMPDLGIALSGLGSGFHGIALMLIRAYESKKEKHIKDAVYRLLNAYPDYPDTDYLGFENGLGGIGEVYLEAYRVFGDENWQRRADAIAEFLLHSGSTYDTSSRYWMPVKDAHFIPGLLSGQAGILHFLMHYLKPENLKFSII